jgi:hypothetical protein
MDLLNLTDAPEFGSPLSLDLINFIKKHFVPLNLMMERAGMTKMDICNRRH